MKYKDLLLHLKRKCIQQPDIDAFSLQTILGFFVKKLQAKIAEIKEHCKQNNLESALSMQNEFLSHKDQLMEIEQRSTITSMVSSY